MILVIAAAQPLVEVRSCGISSGGSPTSRQAEPKRLMGVSTSIKTSRNVAYFAHSVSNRIINVFNLGISGNNLEGNYLKTQVYT
jgi:hypothetical protein